MRPGGQTSAQAAPDPVPWPNSVKRIRDKYEAELSELEQSERKLQERCSELKGRLAEAEGESVRLQGLLRQRDQELTDLRAVSRGGAGGGVELQCSACRRLTQLVPAQVNEQLASERGSLAQVLRQEFSDRLSASEEENRQVRAELAELRAHQRLELEQLMQEKQAELEEMHGRWVQYRAGVLGGTLLQTRVALAETGKRQAAVRVGPSVSSGCCGVHVEAPDRAWEEASRPRARCPGGPGHSRRPRGVSRGAAPWPPGLGEAHAVWKGWRLLEVHNEGSPHLWDPLVLRGSRAHPQAHPPQAL